jgi:hypothetical protein
VRLGLGAGGGGVAVVVVVVVAAVVVVGVVDVVCVVVAAGGGACDGAAGDLPRVVVGAGAGVVVDVAVVVVVAAPVFGGDGFVADAPLALPAGLAVTDTASMKNVDFCRRDPPIFRTSDLASAGEVKWIS